MIFALIQARQSSKRFNNKIFSKLKNSYLIDWVINRTKQSKKIKDIYVVIPNNKHNFQLKNYLLEKKINYFAGSENDVLDRFYKCLKKNNLKYFVRICADNPFICPDALDNLINFYNKHSCDYAYNHVPINNNYPDGLGAEISSLKVLDKIKKSTTDPNDREHIFNYIWKNKKKFVLKTFNHKNIKLNYPNIKLDINFKKDLKKLNKLNIHENVKSENIIQEYLKHYPIK
mgnify:CR=1 FL=1